MRMIWPKSRVRRGRGTLLGSAILLLAASSLVGGGVDAAVRPSNTVKAAKAIALVGPVSAYAELSALPTVVVPATYPTESVPPRPAHIPATAWEHIPPAIAARLAAYLIPVSNGTWITLLGPRGMTGTEALGDDGNDGLTLTNSRATLRVSMDSTQVLAAELEGDLFRAADRVDRQVVPPHGAMTSYLLHPATIAYRQNHHLALFAYQNILGHDVYGFGFYGGQKGLQRVDYADGITVSYSATGSDTALAPWVIYAAKQMVTVPMHAFSLGHTDRRVKVRSHAYTLTVPGGTTTQGLVVAAGTEVVWVDEPDFLESSVPVAPLLPTETNGFQGWGTIAMGALTINVSPSETPRLNGAKNTRIVTQIAPLELTAGGPVVPQNLLSLIRITKDGWLLFRVADEGVGTKPATNETLDAVQLKPNQPFETLANFPVTGKAAFFVGSTAGTEVVYDPSTTATPDPNTLTLVNLATDHHQTLPAPDLLGTTVHFTVAGHNHVVILQQVPTK